VGRAAGAALEFVGFLGIAEAGEEIGGAAMVDFHFLGAFVFRAGFAHDRVGG